jgi:multiple sugar transport system substrate-binding protein
MYRKSLWMVLSVPVMASLILSACAPAATPAPRVPAAQQPAAQRAAQQMVMIRWRTRPDSQAEQDAYQTINDELSKKLEAQGIQLQYDPAPAQGYLDKLTAEYSTGSAPDIAWVGGATQRFHIWGVV